MRIITESEYRTLHMAADNWDDVELLTDYSGRGMWGDHCIAFYIDNYALADWGDVLAFIAERTSDKYALDLSIAARTDTLGLGIVIYWPWMQAPNPQPAI